MARKNSEEILAEIRAQWDRRPVRQIGIWTLQKLAILHLYLPAFSEACQSAGGGYYLDGLAGPGMCHVRNSLPPFYAWGSPLIALRSEPPLAKCVLLEMRQNRVSTLAARIHSYGDRAVLRSGDVNQDLVRALTAEVPSWAPCFCLLDPEGIELNWSTVAAVAHSPRSVRKPELMILFPYQMGFRRLLRVDEPLGDTGRQRLDRVFRTTAWREIYDARLAAQILPTQTRDQFVALYEHDLKALGYKWVRSQLIVSPRIGSVPRREMYHLFFATDHEVGNTIMTDVFSRPYVLDFPASQQRPLFEL